MDKNTTDSTINKLFELLDEQKFLNVINVSDVDDYVKKMTAYRFLKLMIIAQLNKADGLRDLSKQLKDGQDVQQTIDMESISASQLSRKQSELSPEMFEKVFRHLVFEVQTRMKHPPMLRDIGKLLAIDSSAMSMSLSRYPWATFRKTKSGVRLRLRVVVTKDITMLDKAVLLPAKHADRTQMDELIDVDSDAIHLFDRGYNDYQQFDDLCYRDVRFVTRTKKNAQIEVVSENNPDTANDIFLDREVRLGNVQNDTKMAYALRFIQTKDSEDNVINIVTNCFGLSAKEIGDLYRYRWKIETFFKWMKQHLNIKTFYGKSENAVYTQIWIALITYCLQVLLQLEFSHNGPLLELKRTVKNLLFRPLDEFLRALFRKPTRTSKGRRKCNWEEEFRHIVSQFEQGEVTHLNDLTYDPLFL